MTNLVQSFTVSDSITQIGKQIIHFLLISLRITFLGRSDDLKRLQWWNAF